MLAVVIGGASGIHKGTLVVLLKIDLDSLKGAEALFRMRQGNLKGTEEFSESRKGKKKQFSNVRLVNMGNVLRDAHQGSVRGIC